MEKDKIIQEAKKASSAKGVEALSDKPGGNKETADELQAKWQPIHEREGQFIETAQKAFAVLYAGDTIPVERNFIALLSRHTKKPICKIDVAQSSTGKSKAVDTALMFVPEEAYHKVDSASPTAVVYNKESYEHRMLVFSEIDSFPEEGHMASALRALLSDGTLTHEVTEKGDGGKFEVRKIQKEGPTGFLSTATRTPKTQLATRTLVSGVDDSKKQTRLVMECIARDFDGLTKTVNTSAFIAYDRWLAIKGRTHVKIPFAQKLAELLPADLVRMRRDITQLFRVIETITLINQPHREKNNDGALIATLNDYKYARYLLAGLFQDIARGGVSRKVREAVEAVKLLYKGEFSHVTTHMVGEAMLIDRTTAAYHCKKAIESEYLENEASDGKPFRMRPGQPLPEDTSVLPEVRELEPVHLISTLTTQPLNAPLKPKHNAPTDDIRAEQQTVEKTAVESVESTVESLSDKVRGNKGIQAYHSNDSTIPPCECNAWDAGKDGIFTCLKCGSKWDYRVKEPKKLIKN